MEFCIDLNNCQGTYQKCILQDRNFVASLQPQLQSNSDKRMNYHSDQSPEGLEITVINLHSSSGLYFETWFAMLLTEEKC